MGKIFHKSGLTIIPVDKYWRCLICTELIQRKLLLIHTKKCSSETLESDLTNDHAIRYHLLYYIFGLHDNLNKNINFGQYLNFSLEVNRFINELKQNYPNVPNFSNVFFQQELYIIEKIYHALINY